MASNIDSPTRELYTIGHSMHSIERLIELLREQSIEVVSDVRSRPYSRFNPQFNREALRPRAATSEPCTRHPTSATAAAVREISLEGLGCR